ncbi:MULTISPECIES: mannose-1-phosphate guanylyltransferase/mannose-6-phosphate isomerase [unclassified Yoonia]|uniref:mannose-1-phosphate guanylyltransferase/mannose-6-phosphate isomerase n=1 Tax=unclassified Yoonia TaxID=2629118 RepID=UPI002AFDDD8C|nr:MULTISPECIES: mannose-1-phosphate guanylyltransferase/mannose-6-phosphate isomerase [unclassified Yoonia]
MTKVIPVILCGGSGTRLWPLSRQSYPKQFASLTGDESLFQASLRRLSGGDFTAPLIVTADQFRFIARQQAQAAGIAPQAILIEPGARDTGPAVLAAALHLAQSDPDALLLIAPSDHVIPDAALFARSVAAAIPAAQAGQLVTFGITPDRAETGYGYLELAQAPEPGQAILPLLGFIEKPCAPDAARMLAAGRYLWNAGLFLFSARSILAAYRAHAPDMVAPVQAAVDEASVDLGFVRLAAKHWSRAPALSIDYAVMEAAENLSVAPYAGRWSDLGDWAAVWRETQSAGQALSGPAYAMDCSETLLRSENDGQVIMGIGLHDIIAIATPDAVLISHKSRAQDVKQAVALLKTSNSYQAAAFPKDHRPWGWFESLAKGERFQVKRIVVDAGAALSLQAHHHRSEHWIVVQGTAQVTCGDQIRLLTENESIYIPLGSKHRLENPGKMPMVLIEVQTGGYLGEDDIIRYEDVYARA